MKRILKFVPPAPLFVGGKVSETAPVREYDEDEIVEVLRRNGWFVARSDQVHKLDATERVDTDYLRDGAYPMVSRAAQMNAINAIADKLEVRQVAVDRWNNTTVYRCRAYLVVPTSAELDKMDRDDPVPSLSLAG